MNRDHVVRWVGEYERAWREGDAGAVATLFSDEAAYRKSPYESAHVGHDAIRAFWREDVGRSFTVEALVFAVDGDAAVVRVDVGYESPVAQEYRDLWLLRFASDGRVADFEEWAYWPGKPYEANHESA